MKIIDLLNKIANGKEVPLIKYRDKILYWNKEKDRFEDKDGMNTLYEMDFSELNDEVEIIEEEKKIPEKLNYQYRNLYDRNLYGRLSQHKQSEIDIIDTLNGVIDYLKSKGE